MNQLLLGAVPTVEYLVLQGRGVRYGVVPVERTRRRAARRCRSAASSSRPTSSARSPTRWGRRGRRVAVGGNGTSDALGVDAALARAARARPKASCARKRSRRTRRCRQGWGMTSAAPAAGVAAHGRRCARGHFAGRLTDPGAALVTTFVADARARSPASCRPVTMSPKPRAMPGAARRRWRSTWRRRRARQRWRWRCRTARPCRIACATRRGRCRCRAKITVVGAPPNAPDRRFRDVVKDPLPYGVAAWLASRAGDSSLGNAVRSSDRARARATIASSSRTGPSGAASSRARRAGRGRVGRCRARSRGVDTAATSPPTSISTRTSRPTRRCRPKIALVSQPRRRRRVHRRRRSTTCCSTIGRIIDALGAGDAHRQRHRRRVDAVGLRPLHRLSARRRSAVAQRRRARLGRRRHRRPGAGADLRRAARAGRAQSCRSTIRARRRSTSQLPAELRSRRAALRLRAAHLLRRRARCSR